MKCRLFIIIISVTISVPGGVKAWESYENQRLDRALYEGHDQKLVVAGYIRGINIEKRDSKDTLIYLDGPGPIRAIDFEITDFILSDTNVVHRTSNNNYHISSFDWPSALVPLEVGQFCILIMNEMKSYHSVYHIISVVPTLSRSFVKAKTTKEAKQILMNEILLELENEETFYRQSALIRQLAPILTSEASSNIVPFISSSDLWVKRAAICALAYSNEDPKYLKMLTTDVKEFVSNLVPGDLIAGMEKSASYAPRPYYFRYCFFLDNGWSIEEKEKNQRIYNKMKALNIMSEEVIKWIDGPILDNK